MKREELTAQILDAKRKKGLSWKQIADAIGPGSPVLYTAALLGQMTLTREETDKLTKLLDLDETEAIQLTEPPYRGSLTAVPLIEEEFGDGIMSAIDFDMEIEREANPKGDRVRISMSGKFLPYKRY